MKFIICYTFIGKREFRIWTYVYGVGFFKLLNWQILIFQTWLPLLQLAYSHYIRISRYDAYDQKFLVTLNLVTFKISLPVSVH